MATKLYPLKKDVEEENEKKLTEITGKGRLYKAKDAGVATYIELLEVNFAHFS